MIYLCENCGEEVRKPALVALKDWKSASVSDFSVGLGKWHCKCGTSKVKAVKGQSEKNAKNSHPKRKFKNRKGKEKRQALSNARTPASNGSAQSTKGALRPQEAPRTDSNNANG